MIRYLRKGWIGDLSTDGKGPPYVAVWWIVFAYTGAVAALVQLIALPHVFPAWHVGDGILAGMDSVAYHALAAEIAERIRAEGWTAWELRPQGHFSVGLASAIYAITVSKPWAVIPVNAAVHALSAVVLLRMFVLISPNWKWALMAMVPFVFFPSAANWYTQLLKDGYFFAGVILYAYGWMVLAQVDTWQGGWRKPAGGVLWTVIGFSIIGLVRPFSLSLILSSSVPLFLVYIAFQLGCAVRHVLSPRRAMTAIGVGVACLAILAAGKAFTAEWGPTKTAYVEVNTDSYRAEILWESPEDGAFSFLDHRLLVLSIIRFGYTNRKVDVGSVIDADVIFGSAPDVIRYVPRAAQIAFLAPFPYHWLGTGTFGSTTLMRRISMFEMLAVYIALAFLPFALWQYRGRGEAWVLVAFCASVMVIYALAIPNLGALYRLRYGFLMPLVGLGVLGGMMAWEALRRPSKRNI